MNGGRKIKENFLGEKQENHIKYYVQKTIYEPLLLRIL